MIGRKIPYTKSRAIATMQYNEEYNDTRRHLKQQARREERRYFAQIDRINSTVYDGVFSTADMYMVQYPYIEYRFNDDMTLGVVYVKLDRHCICEFIIDATGTTKHMCAATKAVVEHYENKGV